MKPLAAIVGISFCTMLGPLPVVAGSEATSIGKVELARNRAIHVNGQPFFPIMAWLQDAGNFTAVRDCGMNTTAGYWPGSSDTKHNRRSVAIPVYPPDARQARREHGAYWRWWATLVAKSWSGFRPTSVSSGRTAAQTSTTFQQRKQKPSNRNPRVCLPVWPHREGPSVNRRTW